MIFVSTNIPLEEIKTEEDMMTCDWFIFQGCINGKNVKYNSLLRSMCNRVSMYCYYYDKPLRLYLMSDNYYYKSSLYEITKNLYQRICMLKVPPYFSEENMVKYPVIPKESRIMSEQDIMDGFIKLGENNFKENPMVEIVIYKK